MAVQFIFTSHNAGDALVVFTLEYIFASYLCKIDDLNQIPASDINATVSSIAQHKIRAMILVPS